MNKLTLVSLLALGLLLVNLHLGSCGDGIHRGRCAGGQHGAGSETEKHEKAAHGARLGGL